MTPAGIEQVAKPSGNPHIPETGGSKSGNNHAGFGPCSDGAASSTGAPTTGTPTDPELRAIMAAWPTLPPAIRAGIVAMVKVGGV
jgi:hypothetical protein